MIAKFFIDRPIFATVLSIVITLTGALAAVNLPLSQYPPVAPPTIQIDCNYPGASSQVVAETIAAPIEQQVNGVEGMMYMSSQSTSDGSYTLTVTFKIGTDLNMAQVLVQNRVALAMPNLPDVVRATGITTRKRSPELLMTVSINSPEGRYDQLYLSNYGVTHIKEEVARIKGISDVTIFGQRDYSTRVWVNPEKLTARNLTALDVVNALRAQNAHIAAGQIGQPPTMEGQPFQLTLTMTGRLTEPEEFENVIVKATPEGRIVRLKDVATVELGAKSQDISNRFDRKQTIGLGIFILSDANALETSEAVKAKMEELSRDFPEGVRYEIGYDTTPFIRSSIMGVFKSLREAIILVAIVVLVFLQSWRSALIPLAAVPVAIVGTFAVMAMVGFSMNNLTLFGLVLAVGIVVDDAIVVVEAVEHHIELGLAPREATIRAMEEVSGPIVAVGVVLGAVFIPCAFLSGIVGQFFRQFALTIAISTLISTFNSLTLSPALAAVLLKPKTAKRDPLAWLLHITLGWFFWLFNRSFNLTGRAYGRIVGFMIRVPLLVLVVYGGLLALGYWQYQRLPTGFIPQQDKGYMIASIQMPDAASAERMRETMDKVQKVALETPGVRHVNAIAGNSFVLSAYGSNFGSMFIILDDFPERTSPDLYADMVANKLRGRFAALVPDAQVNVFGAPAVSGLGRAGGIKMMIEDRGDLGPKMLQGQTENFIDQASQQRGLVGLFSVFKTNAPQAYLEVDREACIARGVQLSDVFGTLQATMGSRYVNDFNRFGRTWQVNVQAESRYRDDLMDVKRIHVRNNRGQMIPLAALLKPRESNGVQVITRYNMYPAAAVNGNVAPGTSSGDAIATMEKLAEQELPERMSYEWTELTYMERQSRNTGLYVFAVSVVVVFLVLTALYESWALPLSVILVVPMCVVCSVAGVAIAKHDVNVFTQIGFVVLIGLACKNAILIVEFAKYKTDEGVPRREAVLAACRLRFRPIMMTSFAFILGVLPLLFAQGAGSEMRRTLGTAVFSGMLGVTIFGIFLTPVFFVVVDSLARGSWFKSPRLQRTSRTMLKVLRLEFVPPLAKLLGAKLWSSLRGLRKS